MRGYITLEEWDRFGGLEVRESKVVIAPRVNTERVIVSNCIFRDCDLSELTGILFFGTIFSDCVLPKFIHKDSRGNLYKQGDKIVAHV